jgi:tetratricopeptide (TPR) repeat protein
MDTPYWKDDQAKLEIQNKVIAQALNKINRSSVDNRLYRLAKLHYILGENIPAKQYLKELMKQEPDNLAAKLLQATILIDENNNAEADLLLDNTIELNPRSYQAWALKGIIHLDNKKPIDARGMLETSTKIRKTSYAYWLLGKTYARTGEYSQEMMMYIFAIEGWEYPSLFSNWIGYRFPIPGEKLPCMPELKTYRDHYDLAWDAIYEIGERDCCQAEGLYQQIFENEMSNSIYSNRFEDLPCSEKLDDLDCSRK